VRSLLERLGHTFHSFVFLHVFPHLSRALYMEKLKFVSFMLSVICYFEATTSQYAENVQRTRRYPLPLG